MLDRQGGESMGAYVRRIAGHFLFEGAEDWEIASHCGCTTDTVCSYLGWRTDDKGQRVTAFAASGLIDRLGKGYPYPKSKCAGCEKLYCDTGDGRPHCGECRLNIEPLPDPVSMRELMDALEALFGVAEYLGDAATITAIDEASGWLMGAARPSDESLRAVASLAMSQVSGNHALDGTTEIGDPFPDGFVGACCRLIEFAEGGSP